MFYNIQNNNAPDKTDLRLYLLGTNHNLRKKQNIEVELMQY
jgi:hypothetical protein